MLAEIRCEKFNQKIISFHNGLNVVLGDDKATNSIGTTTLLMIIDFIFGGNTYISNGADIIENLGNHEFKYRFDFNNESLYFIRDTNNYKYISICDEKYNKKDEISLDEYKKILFAKYELDFLGNNARTIVGTCSRIWGKDNYTVDKPLKTKDSKNDTAINNLIKLFNKYNFIESLENQINKIKSQNNAIRDAIKSDLFPTINKKQYESNKIELIELNKKIEDFKKNVDDFSLDLKSLMSEELTELKNQKNALCVKKNQLLNKIKRIQNNLNSDDIKIKNKFNKLVEFFPNINMKKLNEINDFHNKVSSSLKNELTKEKEQLEALLDIVKVDIENITLEIEKKIKLKNTSSYSVDRLTDLLTRENNLRQINQYYEKAESNKTSLKDVKEELSTIKTNILSEISNLINIEMYNYFNVIYKDKRTSPTFSINLETYNLKRSGDTGTGSAYINLIAFDLSLFNLTKLPILIHDTIMFKNVEVPAFENLTKLYNSFSKQIFISIDEVYRFSKETKSILNDKKVIALDEKNTLFIKNWKLNAAQTKDNIN